MIQQYEDFTGITLHGLRKNKVGKKRNFYFTPLYLIDQTYIHTYRPPRPANEDLSSATSNSNRPLAHIQPPCRESIISASIIKRRHWDGEREDQARGPTPSTKTPLSPKTNVNDWVSKLCKLIVTKRLFGSRGLETASLLLIFYQMTFTCTKWLLPNENQLRRGEGEVTFIMNRWLTTLPVP